MKKGLSYTFLGIIGLIILVQSGVLDALVAFLLVGAIPGTTYSVPSGFMLLLMAVTSWLLVLRFTAFEIEPTKKSKKQRSKSKKQMPKRRYSQI